MGVSIRKGCIHLVINPEFIEGLSVEQLSTFLQHEVLHVVFGHVSASSGSGFAGAYKHRLQNIAMDCAINQHLQHEHIESVGGVTLQAFNKVVGVKCDPLQTWEYYYQKLNEMKDVQKAIDALKTIDEHGFTEDPSDSKEGGGGSKSEIEAAIKQAMDKAAKAAAGNVPNAIIKVLEDMNNLGQLPWQQLLANFVARCATSSSRHTKNRSNRRYGFDQPGKRRKRELYLGVCEDTSGSVSMDATVKFRAELDKLTKHCAKVFWVDADCVVQNTQKLRKGQKSSKTRTGGGGTAYQPAIDACMKERVDAIVYFGDMDSADKPSNPQVPVLWVAVGQSLPPADFGSVIRLGDSN
jgi:predicted metal-dependent peptidase